MYFYLLQWHRFPFEDLVPYASRIAIGSAGRWAQRYRLRHLSRLVPLGCFLSLNKQPVFSAVAKYTLVWKTPWSSFLCREVLSKIFRSKTVAQGQVWLAQGVLRKLQSVMTGHGCWRRNRPSFLPRGLFSVWSLSPPTTLFSPIQPAEPSGSSREFS